MKKEKIQRFSLRKLSVGLVSAAVGSIFLAFNANIVQAGETTSSVTYRYVVEDELTDEEKKLIIKEIPKIEDNKTDYYLVYKPTHQGASLPYTGSKDIPEAVVATIASAFIVVGICVGKNKRQKITSVLLVTTIGGTLLSPSALAISGTKLSQFNQIVTVVGNELPTPLTIENHRYIGYIATGDSDYGTKETSTVPTTSISSDGNAESAETSESVQTTTDQVMTEENTTVSTMSSSSDNTESSESVETTQTTTSTVVTEESATVPTTSSTSDNTESSESVETAQTTTSTVVTEESATVPTTSSTSDNTESSESAETTQMTTSTVVTEESSILSSSDSTEQPESTETSQQVETTEEQTSSTTTIKQAEKFNVIAPKKTLVKQMEELTADEIDMIKAAVKAANPHLPSSVNILVDNKGKVTLVYEDNSIDIILPSETVEQQLETIIEVIPFGIVYEVDETLNFGQRQVSLEGKLGKKNC